MAAARFPANLEYERQPELKRDLVESLLNWAHSQPYLPKITEEDAILFLSSCLYDIEQAKYTIDAYYTFRTKTPELYSNRDPLNNVNICQKYVAILALPVTTDEGDKIIYTRLIAKDPQYFNFDECVKTALLLQDIIAHEEGAVNGLNFVIDLDGIGLRHLAKASPVTIKKLLYYVQEAMPLRLRSINFVNPVIFMDTILSIIRPFIKSSVIDSIIVHSNFESLYKKIPKKFLPKEVGGDLQSVSTLLETNNAKIMEYRDWLMAEEQMRIDESLKPNEVKKNGGFFGLKMWSS